MHKGKCKSCDNCGENDREQAEIVCTCNEERWSSVGSAGIVMKMNVNGKKG